MSASSAICVHCGATMRRGFTLVKVDGKWKCRSCTDPLVECMRPAGCGWLGFASERIDGQKCPKCGLAQVWTFGTPAKGIIHALPDPPPNTKEGQQ